MKKSFIRILSIVLAFIMISMSAIVCFAGNEPERPVIPNTDSEGIKDSTGKYSCYFYENGEVGIASYLGNEVNVEIPSDIDGYKVVYISQAAFSDNNKIKSVIVPDTVKSIHKYAFLRCEMLEKISLPDTIEYIEEGAFDETAYYNNQDNWDNGVLYIDNHLIIANREISGNYIVRAGTKTISAIAFDDCDELTGVTVSEGVRFIGTSAFSNCDKLESVMLPNSLIAVGYDAFRDSDSLEKIDVPKNVATIYSGAFYHCDNLKEVRIGENITEIGWQNFEECNEAITVYGYTNTVAEDYANENNITFISIGVKEIVSDIYNLGEETYSFDNFGDSDSVGGHCFGMSMTSAAYYNNILDITDVGGNTTDDVHGLSKNSKVKSPICHYQAIQGYYSISATVAGGSCYLYGYNDIQFDWKEVIDYVSNHDYDNKGTLQIGFRKSSQGGHAINFLRYEVVDGQERIYAYDNNFPDTETYFYKASNGNIYQAPYSTFDGAIDCIALRNVNKYFDIADDYDAKRYIYGDSDCISIAGAIAYPMECGNDSYTMFEIPDGVNQIVIMPLVDGAEFRYCDNDYNFGNIEDDTIGIFTLATEDDELMSDNFVVTNLSFSIQTPSRTTIRNRDTIVLHAVIDGTAPEGSYIKWDGEGPFSFTWYGGNYYDTYATAEDKGYDTITATLYDADGNVLATDSVTLYSKSGFFDKIGGFFRFIFGTTKTYEY